MISKLLRWLESERGRDLRRIICRSSTADHVVQLTTLEAKRRSARHRPAMNTNEHYEELHTEH